jgi:hypothetical protein
MSLQTIEDNAGYDTRPSFRINNRTYISAGVLFYTVVENGDVYFMMQKVKGKSWQYEDFGGKSQQGDLTIKDVAFRECVEELNGIITKELLSSRPSTEYLVPGNKYIAYLVHLDSSFKNTDMSVFSDREFLWNIERKVEWIKYSDLWNMHPTMIHPRLQPDLKQWLPLLLVEAEEAAAVEAEEAEAEEAAAK